MRTVTPSTPTTAPECERCRRRLAALTRTAAAIPKRTGVEGLPFPDPELFDPVLGVWMLMDAPERPAFVEYVYAFLRRLDAPRPTGRPALRVILGGRDRRRRYRRR